MPIVMRALGDEPPHPLECRAGGESDVTLPADLLRRPAFFSADRRYRYTLRRDLSGLFDAGRGPCVFVMHNCSVADETRSDPTITRCIRFAKAWRCSEFFALNRFAVIGTDPAVVFAADDPVGPLNDAAIVAVARHAVVRNGIIIAAWGAFDQTKVQRMMLHRRAAQVVDLVRSVGGELGALALTADGQPRHPLYLSKSLTPFRWTPPSAPR